MPLHLLTLKKSALRIWKPVPRMISMSMTFSYSWVHFLPRQMFTSLRNLFVIYSRPEAATAYGDRFEHYPRSFWLATASTGQFRRLLLTNFLAPTIRSSPMIVERRGCFVIVVSLRLTLLLLSWRYNLD